MIGRRDRVVRHRALLAFCARPQHGSRTRSWICSTTVSAVQRAKARRALVKLSSTFADCAYASVVLLGELLEVPLDAAGGAGRQRPAPSAAGVSPGARRRADGVPADAQQPRDRRLGHLLRQPHHDIFEDARVMSSGPGPRHGLQPHPTHRAPQPAQLALADRLQGRPPKHPAFFIRRDRSRSGQPNQKDRGRSHIATGPCRRLVRRSSDACC